LNEEIQNQGPNWKRHMNIGADAQIQKQWSKRKMRLILGLTFEFDKVAIELILKIKIAIEDWIEQKKKLKANSEIWQFLVHFSFKWNDAFCTKQRRFTHYSLKKNEEQGVVFTTLYIIFFLWTRKGREEKVFLPLLCSTSLSLSLSETQKNQ